jgi:hypothetical protein
MGKPNEGLTARMQRSSRLATMAAQMFTGPVEFQVCH